MKAELVRLLQASNRLPSPPGVALRILELGRSDDATPDDLARTLSSDPALAGRILKFVNSPQAGLGRSISSLEQAVSQIGFRGVQMMALSFSLVSSGRSQVCAAFEFEAFWSRSLACAVASKVLADTAGRIDPNEAFITGLLYHIGQIALACGAPEQYAKVIDAAAEPGVRLDEVERGAFEATHLEISAWLLQEWKLPETIWQTMLKAREPQAPPVQNGRLAPASVLRIADVIASLLADTPKQRSGKAGEILRLMSDYFGIDADEWAKLYDEIVTEWRVYGQLLSTKAGTDLSFRELQEEAREQITALSVAAQIENLGMRQQNQQLFEQSWTDALTGIANRGSFDKHLAQELGRAQRIRRPMVLCLVDVDHFKKFNDAHGHQIGDEVLKVVARILAQSVRTMDRVARYGGEEFAVIAPECEPGSAEDLAERMRAAVASIRLAVRGKELSVTVSVGVAFAQWPNFGKTAADLIHDADNCLYQAKRGGRNRCCVETGFARAA